MSKHELKKSVLIVVIFVAVCTTVYLYIRNRSAIVTVPDCSIPVHEIVPEAKTEEVTKETIADLILGTAETSYLGSTPGRSKNIELGTARIDGAVVQPGAEFSFVQALGTISTADGFELERVFRDGKVTLGVGGGLCQVSTTLFQSVLSAGFPVTERKSHTYKVSYYKPGLDATISSPHPDLRFVNDTAYPVVIKGLAKDGTVRFELLGIPDGRKATIGEAKISKTTALPATKYVYDASLTKSESVCQNTSQRGYRAEVPYTVTYADGSIKEQVFVSHYLPMQRVCRIPLP